MVCPKIVSHFLIGWFTCIVGSECQDPYISSKKQERARPELCRAEKDLLKLDFLCFLALPHHDQQKLVTLTVSLRIPIMRPCGLF
jgi:hypothetical protein